MMNNPNGDYDDIISMPHHVSRTHPRMTPHDRAAQFAPYAALAGYGEMINESVRPVEKKAELTGAEKAAIGETLSRLKARIGERPEVSVTYFVPDGFKEGGAFVSAEGRLRLVNPDKGMIVFEDGLTLRFDDILSIEESV